MQRGVLRFGLLRLLLLGTRRRRREKCDKRSHKQRRNPGLLRMPDFPLSLRRMIPRQGLT